jgi:hypothetical protein
VRSVLHALGVARAPGQPHPPQARDSSCAGLCRPDAIQPTLVTPHRKLPEQAAKGEVAAARELREWAPRTPS